MFTAETFIFKNYDFVDDRPLANDQRFFKERRRCSRRYAGDWETLVKSERQIFVLQAGV